MIEASLKQSSVYITQGSTWIVNSENICNEVLSKTNNVSLQYAFRGEKSS